MLVSMVRLPSWIAQWREITYPATKIDRPGRVMLGATLSLRERKIDGIIKSRSIVCDTAGRATTVVPQLN